MLSKETSRLLKNVIPLEEFPYSEEVKQKIETVRDFTGLSWDACEIMVNSHLHRNKVNKEYQEMIDEVQSDISELIHGLYLFPHYCKEVIRTMNNLRFKRLEIV